MRELQESELWSQELQEFRSQKIQELGEASPRENAGRWISDCSRILQLLQLLTPEFRNVLGGQAQVSEKRPLPTGTGVSERG